MVSITSITENATAYPGQKSDLTELCKSPCKIQEQETALNKEQEDKLECPICFERFDTFTNAPHVLHCGHTLCRSCVLSLSNSVLKFQKLRSIVLPFLVSCPWCNCLSLRLIINGYLKFPSKNYFILWMLPSAGCSNTETDHQIFDCDKSTSCYHDEQSGDSVSLRQEGFSFDFPLLGRKSVLAIVRKSWTCFAETAKRIPVEFVLIFLVLCTMPLNALVLFFFVFFSLFAWSAFVSRFHFPRIYSSI